MTLQAANVVILTAELQSSVAAPGRFHSKWLQWIHIKMLPAPLCMSKELSNRKPDYNGATASAWGCICISGNSEYSTHRRDDNLRKNLERRNCDFAFILKVCWRRADRLKQREHSKLCQISLLLVLVGKWSFGFFSWKRKQIWNDAIWSWRQAKSGHRTLDSQ